MTLKKNLCPCQMGLGQSGLDYNACCGPFVSGAQQPSTAEKLMRSRYSAYVKEEIKYLKETLWPRYQADFNELGTLLRAKDSRWLGLDVLETSKGGKADKEGYVLFIARSVVDGTAHEQREKSLFRKKAGRWYYVKPLIE